MKRKILGMVVALLMAGTLAVYGDPPDVSARSYWVYEIESEKILTEHQAGKQTPAASLTKLMTCLLTLEAIDRGELKWNEQVRLPAAYVNPGGSSMDLKPGQRVTVRQLVSGLMIVSANDGAQALAVRLGGSEAGFVRMMNARALALGMSQTRYLNASGLPAKAGENLTSAADTGRLAAHLLKNYGDVLLKITGRKAFAIDAASGSKSATNTLMQIKAGVDGLKTGHTDAAGFCLAATMPFQNREDARLIAVVMGTASERARNTAAGKLLDWAERTYRFAVVIDRSQSLTAGNWGGLDSRPVTAHPAETVERLVKADAGIQTTVSFTPPAALPLEKGAVIGSITAVLADGEQITVPLISDTEILELTLQERLKLFMTQLEDWITSLYRLDSRA